jgi:hypothetical protein
MIYRLKVGEAQFGIPCARCRQHRKSRSMKLSSATILAAAVLPLAGCDTLGHLFHGSRHDPPPASVAATGSNDTRYWDPQRNQWVTGPSQGSSISSTVKPASADSGANPAPAVAPAPTPRASRATGVYNSQTGKIEWQSWGYIPPTAPTAAATKHWWWPF